MKNRFWGDVMPALKYHPKLFYLMSSIFRPIQHIFYYIVFISGVVVNLYGRKVKLASCDDFTREYLKSEGIELNPSEPPPVETQTQVGKYTYSSSNKYTKRTTAQIV